MIRTKRATRGNRVSAPQLSEFPQHSYFRLRLRLYSGNGFHTQSSAAQLFPCPPMTEFDYNFPIHGGVPMVRLLLLSPPSVLFFPISFLFTPIPHLCLSYFTSVSLRPYSAYSSAFIPNSTMSAFLYLAPWFPHLSYIPHISLLCSPLPSPSLFRVLPGL
jgi:hypothetical protein